MAYETMHDNHPESVAHLTQHGVRHCEELLTTLLLRIEDMLEVLAEIEEHTYRGSRHT